MSKKKPETLDDLTLSSDPTRRYNLRLCDVRLADLAKVLKPLILGEEEPEHECKSLPPEPWQLGDRLLRTCGGNYRRLLMRGSTQDQGGWCVVCGETGGWPEIMLESELVFRSHLPLEAGQVVKNLATRRIETVEELSVSSSVPDEEIYRLTFGWTKRRALIPLTLPPSLMKEKL